MDALEDMRGRELEQHEIKGQIFDCPHCGSPAYLMPMALLTYEPRWLLSVTVTCPSCGKDICIDVSKDEETQRYCRACDHCTVFKNGELGCGISQSMISEEYAEHGCSEFVRRKD